MPPMCMYSASREGIANNFHLNHYASRAIGGVGLIILEATSVRANGRLSNHDLGIWSDEHIPGLKTIVDEVHKYSSKIGLQLAHAGRKCASDDEDVIAPSALRYSHDYKMPMELTKEGIKDMSEAFKEGARRANEAGFDFIEIHAAHGYLIHQFLSPLTNKRLDEYGGSLENRTRFLKEIIHAIKEVWPKDKAIFIRVSADDYTDGGIDGPEIVRIINQVKEDIDMVHVSSGGLVPTSIKVYPGYQVSYSQLIREETGLATIAVGIINDSKQAEEILENNQADLLALGRALLRNPYLTLNMAWENDIEIDYPEQYIRAFNMPKAFV